MRTEVVVHPVVKKTVFLAAHLSGLSRVLAARYLGCGMIFALHSIVADDTLYVDQTLRCSAAKLEWVLRWFKGDGFEFVSLGEAVRRLSTANPHPFVTFTLDDGYADNLTRALPVMERFGAPFTVYVTTGMVTREIDAWWFGLAELVRLHDRVHLPELGRSFECPDLPRKRLTFKTIESAIHADVGVLPHVRNAIAKCRIDCSALIDREALSEEQLREISRHPLVTIGGHTTTPPSLAQPAAATVRWEMAENRRFLEDVTGRPD